MSSDGDGSANTRGTPARPRTILELISDRTVVDAALKRAVREALLFHKMMGNPIVVWEDGKVVEIPPEEIPG